MIHKNKEGNQKFKSSHILPYRSDIPQKIKEKKRKSLSSNDVKSKTPNNRKKKRINQGNKGVELSDLSSAKIVNNRIKITNYSSSSLTKAMKSFSRLSSIGKNSRNISIKSLENIIKQKIIDMSLKLEKDDINSSEIEISNITAPILGNKNTNKFHIESGHESSSHSHLVNKKEDKNKTNNQLLFKKTITNDYHKKKCNKKTKEKIFRKIDRKNIVYDSVDDSDIFYERDKIGFYILSDSVFALIFDSLIILCTLFDVIYTPFRVSITVCFCMNISQKIKYIYSFIDLIYISDLIFNFFRTQYDENLKIIKNSEIIIKNYIANQFTSDFFEAIPIFSIILFLCKKNDDYCVEYSFTFKQSLLLFFCYLKQLKLIKVVSRKKNSITNKILNIISSKHNIEKKFTLIKWTILCLYAIYTFISINVFITNLSYPNWITSTSKQNETYFSIYITSFYFLMETVTTVGYGDIVCKSTIGIYFQIIFLTVGVCIYSWVISNICNYVKNQDYAAVKCNKDEELLEEIRIAYPEMPFKLYHQILQHLKSRKLRQQKCDANVLINSLPYSLRNHLLLTMYKQTTDRLKICKNCSNSDFTIKLLTSFIPLFSKKNGLLIHEGELIESIVFVNDGRLALEAPIDIEFPEHSVYQYLYVKFRDINDIIGSTTYMDSSSTSSHITFHNFIDYKRAESFLDRAMNSSNIKGAMVSGLDETSIGRQIGKYEYDGNYEESNYKYINIINILKNESYGSVYMFLDKPSPLSLRVKSKKAELFLLRKFDAFAISRLHPNIWKRFQKKAYLNMASVKNLTIKVIKEYSKNNDILPIRRQPNKKSISDVTAHNYDNSSNNYKESSKSSNKNLICFSSSSNNNLNKITPLSVDKIKNKFSDKEQSNDLMANINKVINSKKNDKKNKNQDINFIETNKEQNEDIKNEESIEFRQIKINKISLTDQSNISKNTSISFSKSNFFGINNLNSNQIFTGSIVSKRKTSSINDNTAHFGNGQGKNTNFELSQYVSFGGQNENKKTSSVANTGIFSFCDKIKNSDKKSEVSGNEQIENRSEYVYSFNNQMNQDIKSTSISNVPSLFTNKKKTETKKRNSVSSFSMGKNKQQSKLNNIGKLRLRFIRKLTKKIKKLKTEKDKYKNLTRSVTQSFHEYVRRQTTKAEETMIKNIKTLDDAENKETIYDIDDKIKNQIQTQNNTINNVTIQNNNKFLVQIPEFSSSETDSQDNISSDTPSRSFDLNEITISPSVKFMCKSKYKNLNDISLGYYAKSKKLRKSVKHIINEFLRKKQVYNEDEQKDNKNKINYNKLKTNSSKSDSFSECLFRVYTSNFAKNVKNSNYIIKNNPLGAKSDDHIESNGIIKFNSINSYKKNNKDENKENIINDNSYDNSNDSNNNDDNNCYTFIVSFPNDEGESDTNIIKLQNMNYLSISPSHQAVRSSFHRNIERNSLVMNNNLKQKICNNTEYEFEHIFTNNNHGNLKKCCSVNVNSNLMKINTINSLYIRNKTKYLAEKKMKIEDLGENINEIINNSNENDKNEKGEAKISNSNNCHIF